MEARIEGFDNLVQHWRQTEERRAFLIRLRAEIGSVDADSPLGKWLEWAEHYIEVSDPLERFRLRNRGGAIRLFLNAYKHEIREVKARGFDDPEPSDYDQQKTLAGILLYDRKPEIDCSEVLELELPADLVLPYETTTPGGLGIVLIVIAAIGSSQ